MKKSALFLFLVWSKLVTGQAPTGFSPGVLVTEFVEDISMNYTFTGPVSAIAVNPLTSQHIVLAAETGGLFETRNAGGPGRRWKHIPSFSEHEIMDVLITPAAGGENIWVACSNTFQKVKGPLIWRREVSGTWTKIDVPATQPMKAYRLAYNPYNQKVYACGDFGILTISKTSGGIAGPGAWTVTSTAGPSGRTLFSFDVLQNGTFIAGNGNGVFSLVSGSSWTNISVNPSIQLDVNRFCIKADASRKVAVVLGIDPPSGLFKTYSTVDNGRTMQAFPTTIVPIVPKAGGVRSVYPDYDFSSKTLTIYISNQFDINYATATANTVEEALSAMQLNTTLSWASQITGGNVGHADTRQIAFLRQGVFPAKMVVTSDGGFHIADIVPRTAPGSYSWQMENTNSGLKSLQITSVTGKDREVFFATWHDAFGASLDNCATFYNGPAGEGIVLSKQGVRGQWDDRIFVTDGVGAQIRNSRVIFNIPGATVNANWPSPPNGFTTGQVSGPIFCSGNIYVEQTNASTANMFTWNITNDAGARWTPIGNSPWRRFGFVHGIGERPGETGSYSIIVPVLDRGTIKLTSINNRRTAGASISTPPILSGLSSGIGNLNLGNTNNAIIGVNPFSCLEMMACDNATGKLMKSNDGGDNWSELTSFTAFYNDANEPGLKSSNGYNSLSTISYSPYQNGVVLVGTLSQGVYLSRDGGTSWKRLPDPGILMCTTIHWVSGTRAIISTYGRGLFRVRID